MRAAEEEVEADYLLNGCGRRERLDDGGTVEFAWIVILGGSKQKRCDLSP